MIIAWIEQADDVLNGIGPPLGCVVAHPLQITRIGNREALVNARRGSVNAHPFAQDAI